MPQLPHQTLDGPDFLEAMADIALGNSETINADHYHRRAREWRQLQRDHDALVQRNGQLQVALDNARRAINQAA